MAKKTLDLTVWEDKWVDLYPIEIRSVDAWRDPDGGWSYNDSFVICREEVKNVLLNPDITNRKLLKFLRDMGVLSAESKGKVRIHESWPYIEVQNKNTEEPLIQIYFDEDGKKEFYV